MYSPQQLYQFLQYAKQYLETEDFEFKNGDTLLNPNNEEDITRLISIALAEHRDGDKPSGFAQNVHGDQGRSRGPWQIYGSTWESELRKYDVFKSFDNINDALDDPGLNAIAALIVGQYDVGDRTGINNWTTNEISGQQEFLDAAKQYDTQLIENPEQIQLADGTIQEIPADPTVQGFERSKAPEILEVNEQTKKSLASIIEQARHGTYFKNDETYLKQNGNRIQQIEGSKINEMTKNMLVGVEPKDMSARELIDMYAKNINIYLPLEVNFRGVPMQEGGQNIVDLLQNKNVNEKENYYDTATGKVINGKVVNQRLNAIKTYVYLNYLNKKSQEPLEQLNSVYEYIFKIAQPYIKVSDDFVSEIGDTPDTTIRTPGTGFPVNRGQFLEEFNNTRFPKRPGQNLGEGVAPQEAAPTFLNNLEKILRVKPQGNKPPQVRERNAIGDMFDR